MSHLQPLATSTTLSDLLAGAQSDNPSPNWDFEPDSVRVPHGTVIKVVDQGGEPHTFTEVQKFGGGFPRAAECAGRNHGAGMCRRLFEGRRGKDPDLQGSTIEIPNFQRANIAFSAVSIRGCA